MTDPDTVWIVERNQYEDRYIDGIYATLEMACHAHPTQNFFADPCSDGESWSNRKTGPDMIRITMLPVVTEDDE